MPRSLLSNAEEPALRDLDLLNWRFEQLERAGYPVEIAITLSARSDVDLHLACELLRRGATVQQALRILL